MLRTTTKKAALVAAAACVAVGSAATGVIAATTSDDEDPAPPFVKSGELIKAVQPDQAEAFAIFARERTRSDVMPAGAQKQLGDNSTFGRPASLSRAIATATGTGWALPGDGVICLAVPDPIDSYGVTCTPTVTAKSDGAMLLLGDVDHPGTFRLTMLLPKDASLSIDGVKLSADTDGVVSKRIESSSSVQIVTPGGDEKQIRLPRQPRQG